MIYEKMLKESQRLETKIRNIQLQLKSLPDGKLISASNGKWKKWYISNKSKTTYLPKKELKKAQQLAAKAYLSLQLQNLCNEKNAIDLYLKNHDIDAKQKEMSFITSSKYSELLTPFFTPLEQDLQLWSNQSFPQNPIHPENLIHKTYSGNFVRSKSETLIDMFLYKNKIPFRYECPLELDGVVLYPDFTIRHPKTGDLFYWEHFGMMDNPSYIKSACSKLQLYLSNGIIPTIHLIATYETKENPLDPETVEKIVTHYFL